ncbi:hypothetical protein BHE74_00023130 [Ensete ventricosum]|nr:hypothetical protein BHE74_00023130 [Ensete ventricosum]
MVYCHFVSYRLSWEELVWRPSPTRLAKSQEGIEKYSKRTVKVTRQHNEDCKRLLRLMGVPIIENAKLSLFISKAPCEAEAQCATLCKSDKATDVLP